MIPEPPRWLSNEAWRRLLRVRAATARGAAAKARALAFHMKDSGHDDWAHEFGSLLADLATLAEAEDDRQEAERRAWVAENRPDLKVV